MLLVSASGSPDATLRAPLVPSVWPLAEHSMNMASKKGFCHLFVVPEGKMKT